MSLRPKKMALVGRQREDWKGFECLDFHHVGEELLKDLEFSYHPLFSSRGFCFPGKSLGTVHIVQPPFSKELDLSRNSRHLTPGSVKALTGLLDPVKMVRKLGALLFIKRRLFRGL